MITPHNHTCPRCRKVFTCADMECHDDDPCYECLKAERDLYQTLYHSGPRCQCSDDEACAHVRRAERAEAELADQRKHTMEERDRYKAVLDNIATDYNCDPRIEAQNALGGYSYTMGTFKDGTGLLIRPEEDKP